ncbi:hypothetical protein VTO73DRAFT_12351 [Trametes versicolor]
MSEDAPSEFDSYQLLYRSLGTDVYKFYPTVRAGGDVLHQSLQNTGDPAISEHPSQGGRYYATAQPAPQDTCSHREALHLATPRRHTRLVLQQVCGTLEDFKHPQELVFAMMVALMAWSEAKLLHGDLQFRRRTPLPHLGTWQFTSGLLQRYPNKPYELADELEAFVHVLNWCALKYLRHSLSGSENSALLAQTFHDFYDSWTVPGSVSAKFLWMRVGFLIVEGLNDAVHNPLSVLLGKLAAMCKEHYETKIAELEPPAVQPAPTPGPRIASFGGAADRLAFYNSRHGQGVPIPKQPSPEPNPPVITAPVISPLSSHDAMVAAFCAPFLEGESGEAPMWPADFVKVKDQVPVSVILHSWVTHE